MKFVKRLTLSLLLATMLFWAGTQAKADGWHSGYTTRNTVATFWVEAGFIYMPYSYNWNGAVHITWYRSGNWVYIYSVDQSVTMNHANPNDIGINQFIRVDALSNGSQQVATIWPTQNGSYIINRSDLLWGGVSYPKMWVQNPSLKIGMYASAGGALGWPSSVWTVKIP